MPKTEYVVLDPATGLMLTQYNVTDPPQSLFGNGDSALVFETQAEVDSLAERINSGTVGTIKP